MSAVKTMGTVRNIVLTKWEVADVVAKLATNLKKTAGNAKAS